MEFVIRFLVMQLPSCFTFACSHLLSCLTIWLYPHMPETFASKQNMVAVPFLQKGPAQIANMCFGPRPGAIQGCAHKQRFLHTGPAQAANVCCGQSPGATKGCAHKHRFWHTGPAQTANMCCGPGPGAIKGCSHKHRFLHTGPGQAANMCCGAGPGAIKGCAHQLNILLSETKKPQKPILCVSWAQGPSPIQCPLPPRRPADGLGRTSRAPRRRPWQ